MRTLLRNFGIKNVSIYMYQGIMHIFFSEKRIDGDIAKCLEIPVCINGILYNNLSDQKKPP